MQDSGTHARQVADSAYSQQPFRFADLFAGLGGFHLALSNLGGQAVFAAEWEPNLNSLYEHNFGITPWADINTINHARSQVPDHDVLAAGFPCQPFSKAGEQLGFKHTKQGQLFFKVLEILQAKRPRRFILENVPNILKHKNGTTIMQIEAGLRSLGYDVQYRKMSPHQFGVPQIRERAYIVGSLDGLDHFMWPKPRAHPTDIRHVLDTEVIENRPVPPVALRAIDAWDDFLRSSPSEVKLPWVPIWAMEFQATYPYERTTPYRIQAENGQLGLARFRGSFGANLKNLDESAQFAQLPSHGRRADYEFPKWKQDYIRANRSFYQDNRAWIDPWLNRTRIWELPPSLQKFEWNVQGGRRAIEDYVLQVRASGLRVKRTTTAPSLIAMTNTQVPILGWSRRYMTPRECARLQSLDGIDLPVSDVQAYRALGNAVNAHVVAEIAGPLVTGLTDASSTTCGGSAVAS